MIFLKIIGAIVLLMAIAGFVLFAYELRNAPVLDDV